MKTDLRLLVCLCSFLSVVGLSTRTAEAQSLKVIAEFTEEICGGLPVGKLSRTEIKGEVEANAARLSKLLGVGAGGSGSTFEELVVGIPFEKLPKEIPTQAMCESELAKILLLREQAEVDSSLTSDWVSVDSEEKMHEFVVARTIVRDSSPKLYIRFSGNHQIGGSYGNSKVKGMWVFHENRYCRMMSIFSDIGATRTFEPECFDVTVSIAGVKFHFDDGRVSLYKWHV